VKTNYCIYPKYVSRTEYHHHDDRDLTDGSQKEVYLAAYGLAKQYRLKTVVDVGCGSAYKLLKYFGKYSTVGYEIQPTLDYLKQTYPHKKWDESNLDVSHKDIEVDLIICSDVIEHIVDPDRLLWFLNEFRFKYIVLSTPDRSKLLAVQKVIQSQTGPPLNPAHIREWSFEEFEEYIRQRFDILRHFNSTEEWWTQVIVGTKRE